MLGKTNILISLISAAWFLATAPAFAGDYCITLGGPQAGTYVGKDFKIPKPGECANWRGECSVGCSPDNVQAGVACTASDGSHVSLGITTYYLADNRQFDWIRLNLPTSVGSGNLNYLEPTNPPNQTQNYSPTGAECATQPVR